MFVSGFFEADLAAAELRKSGLRIKLRDQPFRILAMLLERPGEVVSREELHQLLWPEDTFVDFDHGLNAAVNRLREALGDVAGSARFIETVPRRGYRFHRARSGDRDTSPGSAGIAGANIGVGGTNIAMATRE